MARISATFLPAVIVSVFGLVAARPFYAHQQAAFQLRIESLSRLPFEVHVTATSPAQRGPAVVALDTVVPPWASVPIADSVTSIRIVVDGFGAVRATLTSAAGDSVIAQGRDITLARTPTGRFARAWRAQPLVP